MLARQAEYFFAGSSSSGSPPRLIFFDRCPQRFRYILNWLRNGTLPNYDASTCASRCGGYDDAARSSSLFSHLCCTLARLPDEELLEEADFYGLQSLRETIDERFEALEEAQRRRESERAQRSWPSFLGGGACQLESDRSAAPDSAMDAAAAGRKHHGPAPGDVLLDLLGVLARAAGALPAKGSDRVFRCDCDF